MVKSIKTEEYNTLVKNANKPVVLDFTADW
ncbi:thioredoxin [Planococcus glaciei]|jgi:thiol:disulfide interchange protein|uniref:Thioredoxin n=1 Tax=Planococcus glaciei TaxID=459472 RepID=A0A7H8Q864_9BACL|nr:hypothetical protein G159_18690 [Planococcus glaciei CHR43]QDY45238.1 thioredoxin [Planococcus glaciei]QKX50156.1 thioredoxin [Planococcus glaciei]